MRNIDIAYVLYTIVLVGTFYGSIFIIEYIKFRRWLKYMEMQEEAKPFSDKQIKVSKRQVEMYNRVMRNVHQELKSKYK